METDCIGNGCNLLPGRWPSARLHHLAGRQFHSWCLYGVRLGVLVVAVAQLKLALISGLAMTARPVLAAVVIYGLFPDNP